MSEELVFGARVVESEPGVWEYQEYDIVADKYFGLFDFEPAPNKAHQLMKESSSLVSMTKIVNENLGEILEDNKIHIQ